VNIRVENNKINVRVGGGYLSIDEFLEQYTPTELEKLARQDPLKKLTDKVYFVQRLPSLSLQKEASDNNNAAPNQSTSPRTSIVNSSSSPKFGAAVANSTDMVSPSRVSPQGKKQRQSIIF
jgi:hypothetical protein